MVTPLSAVCKRKVRVEGSCLAAWPSEQSMNNPNMSQCTWEASESSLCLCTLEHSNIDNRIFLQGWCRVKVVSPVNGGEMYSVYSASRCCILMSDCRTFYNPHHGIMTSSRHRAALVTTRYKIQSQCLQYQISRQICPTLMLPIKPGILFSHSTLR